MSLKQRKNVKLVDHEQSLKEKYIQLRQNQQKTNAQGESVQQKKEEQDVHKLDLAKKVLLASKGVKQPEPERNVGFKRPTRKPKTQREEQPENEDVENKRQKQEHDFRPLIMNGNYSIAEINAQLPENSNHNAQQQGINDLPQFYPNTVFVGDLGDFIDERELDRVFSQFGSIESIRLVIAKHCAFIKFRAPQAVDVAIKAMNGEILGGGRIRIAKARVPSQIKPQTQGYFSARSEEASFEPFGNDSTNLNQQVTTEEQEVPQDDNPGGRGITNYEDL